MTVYKSVSELIGGTPLVELTNYEKNNDLDAIIVGKVESFNPAGSVKDRVAKAMIDDALASGKIDADTVLIEPTSGNTGIGLAAIAAARGMRLIIAMPETMSVERRNLMKAYGAELVLTDGALGMKGAIARAEELAAEIPNSFIVGQFTNPANPAVHEATTGPEIWEATGGDVDIFVAGVGTGGTVSGAGAYLKRMNPDVQVVAVEPAASPVLSEGRAGAHKIQGIGAGFVPDTLDTAVYDEVITVADEDAFAVGRELAAKEGLLVGISSGAVVAAATQLAPVPRTRARPSSSSSPTQASATFDDGHVRLLGVKRSRGRGSAARQTPFVMGSRCRPKAAFLRPKTRLSGDNDVLLGRVTPYSPSMASMASITHPRKPSFSSAATPLMVVPPGEHTASFIAPGCVPVSR